MCLAMAAGAQIHEGMQEKDFRKQLSATLSNIQWSYAIFWGYPVRQQGVLAWSDGYYNGDIKTRKTTQPMEFKADQIGLQRSEQLRELFESLAADDNNQQTRRPSASLSPEDLTATEWYYLVCMSFTFSPGQGLPGRALASNQHIWLNNAQVADSKTFSRSLLAKSASIQVDKASILGDTIEYLKELVRRVEELESCKEIVEREAREKRKHPDIAERTSDNYGNEDTNQRKSSARKRKACDIEGDGPEHDCWSISKDVGVDINVTVIDNEVMLEMNCPWRDCLLHEIVDAISNIQLDVHSVQSSTINGSLALTLKAKCMNLAVVSPGMVKRALHRVVRRC